MRNREINAIIDNFLDPTLNQRENKTTSIWKITRFDISVCIYVSRKRSADIDSTARDHRVRIWKRVGGNSRVFLREWQQG